MEFEDQQMRQQVVLRRLLDTLEAQRTALELEAEAIFSELSSPGPNGEPRAGLKDPLIDEEGFPRGDIDIYNVRNKRRRHSEINTDYKEIMKRIEQAMIKLYTLQPAAEAKQISVLSEENKAEEVGDILQQHLQVQFLPIAILDEVLEGSPAFTAGVQNRDELLIFGHVTATVESPLQAVAKLVGESVAKPITITVKRSGKIITMTLVPQSWGGRGLLGCHLSPAQK